MSESEMVLTSEDFETELQDFTVTKTNSFDRMWKITPGGSMDQAPLIHEGLIYFASYNFNVYALNVMDGGLAWKFKTEGMIKASPVYWNSKIIIGSYDYYMYALDHRSGELAWKFKTEGEINSTAAVSAGRVYFGCRDRNVYCLDADNGALVWKFGTQGEITSCPAVAYGKVYIGSYDHNLYCLDAGTGRLVWKFETMGELFNANEILVHDGIVYFGSFDNNLRAVDAETGKLVWKLKTGNYGVSVFPVVHENTLYHVARDGILYALAMDGKVKWRFVKKYPFGAPVIYGGRIYVGNEDHNMYCLGMDGREIWKFRTEGSIWIKSAVWKGRIHFSSWDCNLYSVSAETGKLVWKFRVAGAPSYIPPAFDSFEIVMNIPETQMEEKRRSYELDFSEQESEDEGTYKSKISYRFSTRYQEKGKYQIDSDEEAL
jgi:outer membrane protein assembly factor BamB